MNDNTSSAPLASHEDIINNPSIFTHTFNCFHAALGTPSITRPVIGGKDLDLHLLYVEVTRRGGFQKVVDGKRWREVGTVMQFPPTATNASYVLKKTYMSVLLQYEQVYFFAQTSSVAVPEPAVVVLDSGESVSDPMHKGQNEGSSYYTVVGKINEKIEDGYLVTVKIGTETLHGVLYHQADSDSSFQAPSNNAGIVSYNSPRPPDLKKSKRRRDRDPAHPKPNRSAYNFFFSDKHSELRTLYPHRGYFTKMIGEAWNNLPEDERKVYHESGLRDKERYQKELSDYNQRKKDGTA